MKNEKRNDSQNHSSNQQYLNQTFGDLTAAAMSSGGRAGKLTLTRENTACAIGDDTTTGRVPCPTNPVDMINPQADSRRLCSLVLQLPRWREANSGRGWREGGAAVVQVGGRGWVLGVHCAPMTR